MPRSASVPRLLHACLAVACRPTPVVAACADRPVRAWPALREPIETHWEPYLEGRIDLHEAADRLVAATSTAAPPEQGGSP